MSRICWRITLCWVGLPGKPSNATADVLITRRNDTVGLGLYRRFCVRVYPHHTRISSSVPTISHHNRHHDPSGATLSVLVPSPDALSNSVGCLPLR